MRRCPERASRTLPVPDMRPSPFPDSPHSSKNRGWSSKACVAAPVTGQPAPCLRPSWNDRYRLPVVWRSSFRRRSVPARGRGGCSREEHVDVAARCTVLAGFVGRLAYLPAIRSPTLTGHRPKPRPTLGRGRRAHGRRTCRSRARISRRHGQRLRMRACDRSTAQAHRAGASSARRAARTGRVVPLPTTACSPAGGYGSRSRAGFCFRLPAQADVRPTGASQFDAKR